MKEKKIHIVHILNSLGTGGMENGVVNLINNMNHEKYKNSIVTLSDIWSLKNRIIQNDVGFFEIKKKGKVDFSLSLKLLKLLKDIKPDVVHTRNWGTLLDGFLAAKMANVPIIIHGIHGKDFRNYKKEKHKRIYIQRFVFALVDRLIILSEQLRKEYVKSGELIGKDNKITIINNGVDLKKFESNIAKNNKKLEIGLQKNDFVIGNVARLDPIKDHQTLIKAFSEVCESIKNSKLLLVGSGPLLPMLQNLTKLYNVREKTRFLGSRQDIPELLNIMDIYVQSSLYEGMSNTILEAMASKIPVIATDVGGTPDIIIDNETGILIPSGDANALANSILLLSNKDLAQKMGESGYERVKKIFSIEKMVASYENLYEKLVNSII